MNFDLKYFLQVFPNILKALPLTLGISVISMVLGLILALFITLIKIFKVPVLVHLANIYISFFRGTPIIVQLFLFYFGLPQIMPILKDITPFNATMVVLSLNSSAYMSEIFRGAINSIERGQMEASLSVGMTRLQGMRRIILPQAFNVAIPSLGNIFIDLIKSYSLAFILGVTDIMAKAKLQAAASYKIFENYIAVAIIYWVTIEICGILQKKLEKFNGKGY